MGELKRWVNKFLVEIGEEFLETITRKVREFQQLKNGRQRDPAMVKNAISKIRRAIL